MSIRIAVIGTGAMGFNHTRVLRDMGADLLAVVDSDAARRESVARQFKVQSYATADELFSAHQLDAVVVAVPTSQHFDVAMNALRRRVHVLVEKPIASTPAQAEQMIAAAKDAGVVLAVGHIERFNPAIVALKRRLDDGALGKIFMVHSRRVSPYPGRISDVGVVLDLATHELDMMRHLTGSEVVHVQASMSQVFQKVHEDIVFGLLRFESGALGILDVNWVTPTVLRDIRVTGERGMFMVNYLTQELTFCANAAIDHEMRASDWSPGRDFAVIEGDMIRHRVDKKEPLRNELEQFVAAVTDGVPPRVSGNDGLRALELAERIRQTADVDTGANTKVHGAPK